MSIRQRQNETNDSVGQQMRTWRNHSGLTQSQSEERAGLAHNAVSRIENLEVSPRLETVESLASAMSISVEQLQFGRPKFEISPRQERTKIGKSNLIIEKLAALPPDKAV